MPYGPLLLDYAKSHPCHPEYASYLRGQRRQRVTPRVKPQLGYEPRPYDRLYTPAYLASRSFARLCQRQRGKFLVVLRQAEQVGARCQRAPYGMSQARQRAFEAMNQAAHYRQGFTQSAYCREQVRGLVGGLRDERLALVDCLTYAEKHGLPAVAHYW